MRASSPALVSLLAVAACALPDQVLPTFDGPERSTVLLPTDGGPFEEPVAFVANTRSGTIVPLDVKHGVEVSDSVASPFLRPRWLATGDETQLGAVAAWAHDDDAVTVFAADLAHDQLLQLPYVTGRVDDVIETYEVSSDGGTFVDDDGSGDSASLTNLELRAGFTTTERWSIEYNGTEWWVFGSRSGKQGLPAQTGQPFRSDNMELVFTIQGTASSGDRIELQTDVGMVEHDLGGPILELSKVPGEDLLLAAVWDVATDASDLVLWDMAAASEVGRVALPEGSQAWRFAWSGDGAELFVADSHRSVVYDVILDLVDPSSSEVLELATDGPVSALAWVADSGSPVSEDESDDYEHLFVALAETNRVDVFDLVADDWRDANPLDSVLGGVDLESPVVGLASSDLRFKLQQETNWGVRIDKKVVVVTTVDGSVRMLEGDTGCLATTVEGAKVPASQGQDQFTFTDRGATSDPLIYEDDATGRQVIFPSCGGIAKAETWTLVYDGVAGNWEVEGSKSDVQDARLEEDIRYLSDDGAISLLVLSGAAPTTDGDTISFVVEDGQLRLDEVLRPGATISTPFELPGPPIVFSYESGPTGGGWDEVERHSHAMVPITDSDMTVRVRLQSWQIEALWE